MASPQKPSTAPPPAAVAAPPPDPFPPPPPPPPPPPLDGGDALASLGSVTSSVGGPAVPGFDFDDAQRLPTFAQRRLAERAAGTQALAEAMPANPLKAGEHGLQAGRLPPAGQPQVPRALIIGASTVTEGETSDKLGGGLPMEGRNPGNGPLDRVRVDSGGRGLTSNQGVPVADNQNSLKGGLRGPTLLEDFILREKITHFDHERIPERVVHARGSGAHGIFECTEDLSRLTRAAPFQRVGQRTPVFVRFSTVAGERGSADTVRDVRGFATKFYTPEGNWDLVGNNMPVFFIQDAMKFPDLVHALKPEPHHAMPQASSAHDTFWDFVSLMPESAHMLMWLMSDRAIPRSYRTMAGFGVHTFRFVNAEGASSFVKFHWLPVAGTHSLVWDEAVKIAGADPDFHRRDLWEAIEAGVFPQWDLAVQVFSEQQADAFSFDILDPTKIVPEELVPLRIAGRLVLNRNPDNFFAETEQVAFCTAHVIPGIDFSNDPLLQGRIHSYVDTQLIRLGGPNFHEIPVNAPLAEVHNHQRDGLHRQAIHRGRVAYEPNSLAGGCPFQVGASRGFVSVAQPMLDDKVRGKPERFADHFTQARLFWMSQTAVERQHIVDAYRFELTRVQTPAVRQRVVALLGNVDRALAQRVADGLGIACPEPQPAVLAAPARPEVERSPALSLRCRRGDGSLAGQRVALLLAETAHGDSLREVHASLAAAGASPRYVGSRLGAVPVENGPPLQVEITLEAAPSALWDAVVLPAGDNAQLLLSDDVDAVGFVQDQYRHGKPILALGGMGLLLELAGVGEELAEGVPDAGVVLADAAAIGVARADAQGDNGLLGATIARFAAALAERRHDAREGVAEDAAEGMAGAPA